MKFKKKLLRSYKQILFNLKNKINLDNDELKNDTLNDLFEYFGTDKGDKVVNPYNSNSNTAKNELIGHGYAKFYESHLKILKNENISILEIGTWTGASVASFYHYFNKASIFCIDKNFKFKFKSNRINFFNCDTEVSKEIFNFEKYLEKNKSKNFDLIIDDGSHKYKDILNNFQIFFQKIKPGGYYIIEDFNHYKLHPSYANDRPKESLDIDKILYSLNKKIYFESKDFSREFQNFCFKNISDINIYKGIQDYSYIAFVKKTY